MQNSETIVAVFPQHQSAEAAVTTLAENGFDIKTLRLVGKGCHTDTKIVGFCNIGDRVKFWGSCGAGRDFAGQGDGARNQAVALDAHPSIETTQPVEQRVAANG
jgi:hypothetical protein